MELEGVDRAARADPGGRVEAQGLVEDLLEVGKAVAHQLGGGGQGARELGVLLGEQAGDDVGVAGELVEHEGDGRGGGVVAGEEQGHDLVADLQVGERGLAVLVGGVDQQREDVLAALAGGAPAGDLGVDQAVEGAGGFLLAIPGREGSAEHAQGVVAGVEGEGLLEQGGGVDRARGGAVGVEAEERAHGDAQGEAAGPGVEVDGGAGGEGLERRGRSRRASCRARRGCARGGRRAA